MTTSRGTRRRVLLAGAATLALTPLTACGAGTQTAQPQDTGGPPVELLFMRPANQAAADAYNAQVEAFNKQQTRYKGRFEAPALAQGETWETKLTTMLAGDAAPDVFLTGQEAMPSFASSGTLFNLDNHMKRDAKEVDANDFFPSHLGGGKWLGRQMALTADGCALLTYYNATVFQQANVPAPRPTWTWNDYLDAARRTTIKDAAGTVTVAGSSPTAGTSSNQFWLWLWSNGADLFSNDLKQVRITEPAALEALQFVIDLTQRHGAASNSPGVTLGNMPEINGKVAMWNQNRGFFGQLQNVNSWKFNVMPFPRAPRTGQSTTVNVAGQLSIARNNKKPDAAWQWLKFLTGTDAQIIRSTVQQGGCPSRKSATQHKSYTDFGPPALENISGNKTFADVLGDPKMARFIPQYVGMTDASNIFNKHFGAAVRGEQALPAAMETAKRELEDLLRRVPQPTS